MFTNLSLVLLLLLASSLVPKFPLVSYISLKLEAFSWLNITRIGSELSKMAASAYFPVWKSLRGFCITWLYFLISGEIFCVNCFRPISTGNPMNLLAIPYSIISYCLDITERGFSRGYGMYWLDPNGGSHCNAFQAYCYITTHNGEWTMCYKPMNVSDLRLSSHTTLSFLMEVTATEPIATTSQ